MDPLKTSSGSMGTGSQEDKLLEAERKIREAQKKLEESKNKPAPPRKMTSSGLLSTLQNVVTAAKNAIGYAPVRSRLLR